MKKMLMLFFLITTVKIEKGQELMRELQGQKLGPCLTGSYCKCNWNNNTIICKGNKPARQGGIFPVAIFLYTTSEHVLLYDIDDFLPHLLCARFIQHLKTIRAYRCHCELCAQISWLTNARPDVVFQTDCWNRDLPCLDAKPLTKPGPWCTQQPVRTSSFFSPLLTANIKSK